MNQNEAHRDDKLLETMIMEFQRMPVPEAPATGVLLERVPFRGPLSMESCRRSSRFQGGVHWRRHFRVAAIAGSLAALLLIWTLTSQSNNVAIAQVIEAATKHTIAKCNLQQVGEFNDDLKDHYIGNATTDYVMFVDLKSPRMRLDRPSGKTLNGVAEQSWEEILDFSEDRYLQVYRFDLIMTEKEAMGDDTQTRLVREILGGKRIGPHQRIAKLLPLRGGGPPPYSDMGKDLLFLEKLRILQTNPKTTSANDKVGGRDTVKFSLTDGESSSVVWVDPKTRLPVRVEHQVVGDAAGKSFSSLKWTYTDFEWDPEVKNRDTLFSTNPPEGYTLEDKTIKN